MDNNEDLNQVNEEETLYDEMNIPEEIPIENYNEDGAYQAKSNKEIQKERNIETNKKVSRMATEAAANYFGGPVGGKVVNAINNTKTGDRLNEAIGRKMNDISKRSFAGRNIQNTVNKLDDDGTLDKGQAAMNALSGSGAGKGTAKPNANANPNTNIGNNKQKMDFTMNPKKSSIDTNKDKKNEIVRKKIIQFIIKHPWILGIILILFLLMIIMLVILGGGGAEEQANYLSLNSSCSDFPMKASSLSRSEFISLMEKNLIAKQGSTEATNLFVKKAGTIYDIATKNNVNPELVVVRAIAEGFTPGVRSNNFWGLAVYNGQNSGAVYSSFSEGVLAFVNNVSQYNTIVDMMSKYAYIGKYWYNAGSNSLGGCQYAKYMYEFYDNESRAREVEKICAKNACPYTISNGTATAVNPSKCTPTNDEDQLAYARFQASNMAKIRTSIFELEPYDCSSVETDIGNIDISNINDIRELGTLISKKAIATFDHYQYSQARRNENGYVDCSSMVDRAYRLFNINYLYTPWGNAGTTVTESQWCRENGAVVNSTNVNDFIPGDLIFNNNWGHVVMYIGNGQIFEASGHYPSNPESDVRVTNYYGGTVMVCRPLRVYFKNKNGSNNA